jgi:hypothetical protein
MILSHLQEDILPLFSKWKESGDQILDVKGLEKTKDGELLFLNLKS